MENKVLLIACPTCFVYSEPFEYQTDNGAVCPSCNIPHQYLMFVGSDEILAAALPVLIANRRHNSAG